MARLQNNSALIVAVVYSFDKQLFGRAKRCAQRFIATDRCVTQKLALKMRLTFAITWPQGISESHKDQLESAQVNGDVRSQSLNLSKYAGSTS